MNDPRVFFAAERTLLAWIRTGLTVMAFGFVVARVGAVQTFAKVAEGIPVERAGIHSPIWSTLLGLALILVGDFCIVSAALQHRSFLLRIPKEELPERYQVRTAVSCAILLGAIGAAVALFLAWELFLS